ncbi:MAG TPA: histidine triad nucleotide-binding protein [Candidatus Tectomicrobia bacterium]|nr:histidine triad nucleotide-binding protein [Candidatus Tectomicrobia bacterium]
MSDCLFCRIVEGRSPADVEYQDEHVVAFKDIYPKAPVHVLIVPRRHIASLVDATEADVDALGRCVLAARRLAEAKGLAARGFRLSVNTGPEGGQVVYHVHFHFTAGRRPRADA